MGLGCKREFHPRLGCAIILPKGGEGDAIKAKDLYGNFKLWAKSEGAPVLSARKFNSEMDRHPEWHDGKRTRDGYPYYYGLKLREAI